MTQRPQQFPDYFELSEPRLSFNPYDDAAKDAHPLKGLIRWGPYSNSIYETVPQAIRLAAIVPQGEGNRLQGLVSQLSTRQRAQERRAYLPDFPGFLPVFKRSLAALDPVVELPAALDAAISSGPDPQRSLSEAVRSAIAQLRLRRADWDVILIYLPDRWQAGFMGGSNDDFDLHATIKATCAAQAIPTQVINDDSLTYRCRASVCWRLGIALYAKAGGVPWKMDPISPDTAFIGLSYALRTSGGVLRYVTCCSQIFDAEGVGLEFLAYDTSGIVKVVGKNPFLDRDQMRAVMSKSLGHYLDRHGGKMPARVVIHKNTEFKHLEIEGAFDALGHVPELELVSIQHSPWRAIRLLAPRVTGERNRPDNYPLKRGTLLTLGENELLLWTQGEASAVTGGESWFQEGKGLPRPLLLHRYAGHSDAQQIGSEVLALSKMDWNNDQLYNTLPATQSFAHDLAEVVKRIPKLDPRPYALRLFM
jgi:hypothetical protein